MLKKKNIQRIIKFVKIFTLELYISIHNPTNETMSNKYYFLCFFYFDYLILLEK